MSSPEENIQCGCDTKNPLQRDGTSQAQRLLAALDPSYISVDERKPEDLSFEEAMDSLETIVSSLEGERLPLEQMVTRRYTLEQINEACDALARGEIAGRAIVTF